MISGKFKKTFEILLMRKVISKKGNVNVIQMPMMMSINFLPDNRLYHQLSRVNDFFIYKVLKRIIKRYKIHEFVFLNSFNSFYCRDVKMVLKPTVYIYQCVDYLNTPWLRKHGLRLEKEAVLGSDLTLTTSQKLLESFMKIKDKVFLVPNAADVQLFNKATEVRYPKELENIEKPIVGYIGNIDETRIDFDLILELARRNLRISLVLLGPYKKNDAGIRSIRRLPNVILVGYKDMSELPSYLSTFDICLIPFLKNDMTKCIYPLKINEYLAAGKKIITTDFSQDLYAFKDLIFIAKDHNEFISKTNELLDSKEGDDVIHERILVAFQNNWSARCLQIDRLIGNEVRST